MSREPTTNGALSLSALERQARGADTEREALERAAMGVKDGRRRAVHKVGRTEPISMRTFLHIKKMMLDMAEAEEMTYTEIFEDAIQRRHDAMKGVKR